MLFRQLDELTCLHSADNDLATAGRKIFEQGSLIEAHIHPAGRLLQRTSPLDWRLAADIHVDAKDAEIGKVPVIDAQNTLALTRLVKARYQIGNAAGADLRWRSF